MKVPGKKARVTAAIVRMLVLSIWLKRLIARDVSVVFLLRALSRCDMRLLHYMTSQSVK